MKMLMAMEAKNAPQGLHLEVLNEWLWHHDIDPNVLYRFEIWHPDAEPDILRAFCLVLDETGRPTMTGSGTTQVTRQDVEITLPYPLKKRAS